MLPTLSYLSLDGPGIRPGGQIWKFPLVKVFSPPFTFLYSFLLFFLTGGYPNTNGLTAFAVGPFSLWIGMASSQCISTVHPVRKEASTFGSRNAGDGVPYTPGRSASKQSACCRFSFCNRRSFSLSDLLRMRHPARSWHQRPSGSRRCWHRRPGCRAYPPGRRHRQRRRRCSS